MGSTLRQALREPVIAVLVLAGIFDLLSGDPLVHGTVLFSVATALTWDAIHRRRRERAAPAVEHAGGLAALAGPGRARTLPELRPSPWWIVGGLLYAVMVGSFARYSWPASIAVFVPGAIVVGLAWRGPLGSRLEPEPLGRGAGVWAAVFVILALWELANLLLQPSLTQGSYAHPTFSVLMDPILASHAGRTSFLAAWLVSGWFLLER